MAYNNKQMLRDANGDLIPQYWDVVAQDFKPLTGQDGAQDTRLIGSNVELLFSENVGLVPAGVTLEVVADFDLSPYTNFFVQFRPSGGNNYRVVYTPYRGATGSAMTEYIILESETSSVNQASDYYLVRGVNNGFRVNNRMNTDHVFGEFYIFGVRL